MTYKEAIIPGIRDEYQEIIAQRMCPGEFITGAPTYLTGECTVTEDCLKCWNKEKQ